MPPRDVPLDQPLYGATLPQAISRFWRKYATFSGRAGRAEYWWWALTSIVVSFVLEGVRFARLGGLDAYFSSPLLSLRPTSLPWLVWTAATVVPAAALGVRRLHDINRTGWWQLLTLAVFVASEVQVRFGPQTLAAMARPAPLAPSDAALKAGAMIVSAIGSVVLIIFDVSAPGSAGQRFDRAATG